MKPQCVLAFLLTLCLLLSGCESAEAPTGGITDPEPIPGGVTEAEAAPARATLPDALALPYMAGQTLDPITCADGIQQTVGALLYEGLFELDAALEPQPVLCASSAWDPLSLTWTFTLRTDVLFSDGSALTAADVVAALRRAQSSDRYGTRFADVTTIAAPDSAAVQITLQTANARLPALLDIPIVKAGTETELAPVGTGPYLFQDGDAIQNAALIANPNWWQGTALPVDSIVLQDAQDRDTLLYQFASHIIQLIATDLTGTEPVSATSNVGFYDADTTIFQYLAFNTKGLFADARLRKALGLGLNRENLVTAFLAGHATPAQFPISAASALYPKELETPYSYETFQQAMTAAGYASGNNVQSVTLLVNEESSFKTACAQEIARVLSAFDLQISVRTLPWADYTAALAAGDFDLYYGEVRLTADWNLRPLLASGGALNYGGVTNATLDALLSACAANGDAQAFHTLCGWMREQAPILPLCFKRTSVLAQEDVFENLSPTATNPFYHFSDCIVHLADASVPETEDSPPDSSGT